MKPLFENLLFFADPVRRDGPAQMATDEALLLTTSLPVLRHYRWAGPAASFGYAQSFREISEMCPDLPLVRRWTGGGLVPHDGDWTFSLIVPASEPLASARPAASYSAIHEAVMLAMTSCGMAARLAGDGDVSSGPACFANPALYDVLSTDGGKKCGGAQRRTRRGFLHQGSLQAALPEEFGENLARTLARKVVPMDTSPALETKSRELSGQRYGREEWLKKIP